MKFLEEAYQLGRSLDLAKAHYGPHSRTKRYYETIDYYYLLAGLARHSGARTAVDIGTHYGGSALALSIGMDQGLVVSVDLRQRNEAMLAAYPGIKLVTGDSLAPATFAQVAALLPEGADILYIDSFHNYEHTMANVEIYGALKPEFIVFDDITINESMKQAWAELAARHAAFDASQLCNRNCGFGVLDLR